MSPWPLLLKTAQPLPCGEKRRGYPLHSPPDSGDIEKDGTVAGFFRSRYPCWRCGQYKFVKTEYISPLEMDALLLENMKHD